MRLTISSVVQKLKRHRPTSAEEFKKLLGVELVHAGRGGSREAFAIKGTRLIVKFPMYKESDYQCARAHARKEIRRIQQIRTHERYRALRRYIPKFYYIDCENGIVVMEMLNRVGKVPNSVCAVLDKFLGDTFRTRGGCDIGYNNLGFSVRGQIKILDWGWGCV